MEDNSDRLLIAQLGLDVDYEWARLPSALRRGLVGYSGLIQQDPSIISWSEYLKMVSDETASHLNGAFTLETVARAQLTLWVAEQVRVAARRIGRLRRVSLVTPRVVEANPKWRSKEEFRDDPLNDLRTHMAREASRNASLVQGIRRRFDTFTRITFLAATGEQSFTSEFHHATHAQLKEGGLGWFGRVAVHALLPLHWATRNLVEQLVNVSLLRWRAEVRELRARLNGLVRRHFAAEGTNRIRYIELYADKPLTAFLEYDEHSAVRMVQVYRGKHEQRPGTTKDCSSIIYYAGGKVTRKVERANNVVIKSIFYEFEAHSVLPRRKHVYRGDHATLADAPQAQLLGVFQHDERGKETSAVLYRDRAGERVALPVTYQVDADLLNPYPDSAIFDELADDRGVTSRVQLFWHDGSPHLSHIDTFTKEGKHIRTYVSAHLSQRKYASFDLTTAKTCTVHCVTPRVIEHDTWALLKANEDCSTFYCDDLTQRIPGTSSSGGTLGRKTEFFAHPLDTRNARLALWRAWREGQLEAVFARMMDERLLREDDRLTPYWRARTLGRTAAALEFLDKRHFELAPKIEIDNMRPDVRSHLLLRMPDLLIFGEGGASQEVRVQDLSEVLAQRMHTSETQMLDVAGVDSGTWPADGGGVANCRRDLIDRIPGLRWHQFSEIGTPMKTIIYQAEMNVQQLVLIPLWGTELGKN